MSFIVHYEPLTRRSFPTLDDVIYTARLDCSASARLKSVKYPPFTIDPVQEPLLGDSEPIVMVAMSTDAPGSEPCGQECASPKNIVIATGSLTLNRERNMHEQEV